jgi:hypothetical protein
MKQTPNTQRSTPKAFASEALNAQFRSGFDLGVGRWELDVGRFLFVKR